MTEIDSESQDAGREQPPPSAPDGLPRCIQPGGGWVFRRELGWGHLRRRLLRRFWPDYVRECAATRKGEVNPCPFEVIDSRDVKYFVHPRAYHWSTEDDRFAWRSRLPFVRDGLAELLLLVLGSVLTAAIALLTADVFGGTAGTVLRGVAAACVVPLLLGPWFFRNPRRRIPATDAWISPADGLVVAIEEVEEHPAFSGPALRIGIFLSLFNVHVNRIPRNGVVTEVIYRPGRFRNAMNPASSHDNEAVECRFVTGDEDRRPFVVRQIAGLVASRVVCRLCPGDEVTAGNVFGMIKFGSRTELIVPLEDGLEVYVKRGARVKAAETILAKSPATVGVPEVF